MSLPCAGSFGGSNEIIAVTALVSFFWLPVKMLACGSLCILLSPLSGMKLGSFIGCLSKSCWSTGAKEWAAELWIS